MKNNHMTEERKIRNANRGNFFIKRTVLIVDDEEINVEILSTILEEDFHVLKAYDGKEALELLQKGDQKIDMVLLDVFMPFDGREVLKIRQENPELKRIPFIVCTSDKNIEEECFHLGVNDFIKKPYENPDIIVARVKRMIELYEDRSILKEVEREKLTNLYNIDFFKKYAKQFDANFPDIEKDMVLISVNRFRLINELYGHEFADKILLSITGELTDFVSKCKGLLGKESGGTFLLYCEHQEDYEALPKKLEEAVKKDAKDINVSFKIAVYPFVDPSLEKEIVIDRLSNTADTLTNDYGKNVAVYSQEAQTANLHKEELIAAFPEALKEGQFQLYFQPKYEIQGAKPRLTSAEVLIRWISPKFGFVSPGEFISLFEENGLICQLDAYIIQKAAEHMKRWKRDYGEYVPLSINLSRVNLYRPNLVEEIIGYISSNDVPREKCYIEITESAFVEDAKAVIPVINHIRESGFKIEIDDFGSGYSSFGALADLPFDILKIDMQFIRAMEKNPKVKDIVKMIINLAKTLNATVVSEGVETKEQYDFLQENGCDIIQGYYLSKPLPLKEFEELIQKEFVTHGR